MFPSRPTEWHLPAFSTAERPVCVPYKRKGTTPNRLKPKKVGSKSARRERVYKRAAKTRRDFFRRGGTTERAFAARNAAASDAQSVTTSGVRDRKHTEDYKTCVRRTFVAWVEIFIRHKNDSLILCFFVDCPNGIRPRFPPRNCKRKRHNTRPPETAKKSAATAMHYFCIYNNKSSSQKSFYCSFLICRIS